MSHETSTMSLTGAGILARQALRRVRAAPERAPGEAPAADRRGDGPLPLDDSDKLDVALSYAVTPRALDRRVFDRLVKVASRCAVPSCRAQVGWRYVDPEEDWLTADFGPPGSPTEPRFPTVSPYQMVNEGHICDRCSLAHERARWLRHVLDDIAFQHSEAAKAAPEGPRFVPGPPESDARWAPFSSELAALLPAHDAVEAYRRRPDVAKDRSFRCYKAHLFGFLALRRSVLNPEARASIEGPAAGPDGRRDGRVHDDPEHLLALLGQCLWEYAQLRLAAPPCPIHRERQEDCDPCKSLPCGVDAAHLDRRWKELADGVVGPDGLRPLLEIGRLALSGLPFARVVAEANGDLAGEARRELDAWRRLWEMNRENDAACLALHGGTGEGR